MGQVAWAAWEISSMGQLADHPLAVLAAALVLQSAAAYLGYFASKRRSIRSEGGEFGITLPAALTLLGLILGFSFSMAVSRYDQRKDYEEAEANAIGTEYVRADLLPAAQTRLRDLLVRYTEQRILFYRVRDKEQLAGIAAETSSLQSDLWSAVVVPAGTQRDAVSALLVGGLNDVLNSQGYTQAAWWNRIPPGAWLLMLAVAIACNLLVGFVEKRTSKLTLLVLPSIVAVALVLIADIDSPRGGIIRVTPQNLTALYQSFKEH
jgi:hypothetical protein